MELNHRKETVIIVNHFDLQDFIKDKLDVDYDVVGRNDMCNDMKYHFHDIEKDISEFDLKKYNKLKSGESDYIDMETVFNGLCHDGLIEPGNYVVSVCW